MTDLNTIEQRDILQWALSHLQDQIDNFQELLKKYPNDSLTKRQMADHKVWADEVTRKIDQLPSEEQLPDEPIVLSDLDEDEEIPFTLLDEVSLTESEEQPATQCEEQLNLHSRLYRSYIPNNESIETL